LETDTIWAKVTIQPCNILQQFDQTRAGLVVQLKIPAQLNYLIWSCAWAMDVEFHTICGAFKHGVDLYLVLPWQGKINSTSTEQWSLLPRGSWNITSETNEGAPENNIS